MIQQSYSWVYRQHTCTPGFIAALFTIAKTWKQPKCPPTDGWIKKRWCIFLSHKKNEMMPFSAILFELGNFHMWSKSEKGKYDIACVQNLKKMQISLFIKQKQIHRLEGELMLLRCGERYIESEKKLQKRRKRETDDLGTQD